MGPSGYGFLHPSDMTAYVHWDDYDNAAIAEVGYTVLQNASQALLHETNDAAHHNRDAQYQLAQQQESAELLRNDTVHELGRIAMERQSAHQQDRAELLQNATVHELGRIAMQRYIARFEGTSIQAVFSPIMPYVSRWIGNIATFHELIRWTNSQATPPDVVAQQLLKLPQGSFGYVYKLPDITMHEVEALARCLANTHVELVGHRELVKLAHQARTAHSQTA